MQNHMDPHEDGQGAQGAVREGQAQRGRRRGSWTVPPPPPLFQLPPVFPPSQERWPWAAPPWEWKVCRGRPWLVSPTGPRDQAFNNPGPGLSSWSRAATLILEKGLEGTHRCTKTGGRRCHQTARCLQDAPSSKDGVSWSRGPATSTSQGRGNQV